MAKTIVVVGYGPGISASVAEKFGAEGFSVALVARNAEKLDKGVKALESKGVRAKSYAADAGDPAAIRDAIAKARKELGPITVLQWNAYGGAGAGDLLTAGPSQIRGTFDVAIVGLVAAIQEALPDLKESKDGAVLITNGAFGDVNPQQDGAAVKFNSMDLALSNAAKHKLVGLLATRLESEGVYVAEVMIAGIIKGTAWDQGNANIDPKTVAEKYWSLYQGRKELRARIS
jgi:NADP-dependent 3-hydroxy acid dehydrogenase YdfG